jgi:hypothetical protein
MGPNSGTSLPGEGLAVKMASNAVLDWKRGNRQGVV